MEIGAVEREDLVPTAARRTSVAGVELPGVRCVGGVRRGGDSLGSRRGAKEKRMRRKERNPAAVFKREGEEAVANFSRPLVSSRSWDRACDGLREWSSCGRTIGRTRGYRMATVGGGSGALASPGIEEAPRVLKLLEYLLDMTAGGTSTVFSGQRVRPRGAFLGMGQRMCDTSRRRSETKIQ